MDLCFVYTIGDVLFSVIDDVYLSDFDVENLSSSSRHQPLLEPCDFGIWTIVARFSALSNGARHNCLNLFSLP